MQSPSGPPSLDFNKKILQRKPYLARLLEPSPLRSPFPYALTRAKKRRTPG